MLDKSNGMGPHCQRRPEDEPELPSAHNFWRPSAERRLIPLSSRAHLPPETLAPFRRLAERWPEMVSGTVPLLIVAAMSCCPGYRTVFPVEDLIFQYIYLSFIQKDLIERPQKRTRKSNGSIIRYHRCWCRYCGTGSFYLTRSSGSSS